MPRLGQALDRADDGATLVLRSFWIFMAVVPSSAYLDYTERTINLGCRLLPLNIISKSFSILCNR